LNEEFPKSPLKFFSRRKKTGGTQEEKERTGFTKGRRSPIQLKLAQKKNSDERVHETLSSREREGDKLSQEGGREKALNRYARERAVGEICNSASGEKSCELEPRGEHAGQRERKGSELSYKGKFSGGGGKPEIHSPGKGGSVESKDRILILSAYACEMPLVGGGGKRIVALGERPRTYVRRGSFRRRLRPGRAGSFAKGSLEGGGGALAG